jgi:serpin B
LGQSDEFGSVLGIEQEDGGTGVLYIYDMALKSLILIGLLFGGCSLFTDEPAKSTLPDTPKKIELPAISSSIVPEANAFGIDLFTRTAAEDHKNLMLSPLSASVALTMLMNGTDGATYSQIRDMLGYSSEHDITAINQLYKELVPQLVDADTKVRLAIANAIFYRNEFDVKSSFLSTMKDEFDATIGKLDFSSPSALSTINGWASANTNKRIPKVMDELDPNLVMLLMNALYFKGDWTNPFDASKTSNQTFTKADGTSIQVPTMSGDVGGIATYTDRFSALELPYGRKNYSMVLIRPNGSLSEFMPTFNGNTWSTLTSALDAGEWTTQPVRLPLFSFEYEKILNDPLQAMGMQDAYQCGVADFTPLAVDPRDLCVSFVKQNTFVEVNEKGTEAAAVTTIGIIRTSVPVPFSLDKPFIFAIRERTTNTLLFIGQVLEP